MTTVTVRWLQIAIRAFGGAALILGLAFWLGFARSLTHVHIGLGIGVVMCLWAVSWIAWTRTERIGPSALAIVYGLAIWIFGIAQAAILPGPFHWVVQVVHLALGIGAIAIANRLALGLLALRDERGAEPPRALPGGRRA